MTQEEEITETYAPKETTAYNEIYINENEDQTEELKVNTITQSEVENEKIDYGK